MPIDGIASLLGTIMKRFCSIPSPLFIIMLALLCALAPRMAKGQSIVVNELFNSSSTGEWVELVVVGESVDLRGWDLRDFSSGGSAQSPLTFSTHSLWSSLQKGTIIVVGDAGSTFTEDTDPVDKLLLIKSSNGLYFSGTVFLFAGSSDAVQIRNAADTHIFGVSWGTNNAASLPSPKVHFTAGSTSGTSTNFSGNDTTQLTSTSNWTQNSATSTQGLGNGGNNSSWIATLRSNTTGNGSGSATVDPDTLTHGVTQDFLITFVRDNSFSITDMRIVLPSNFSWSRTVDDVSFTNMTATEAISGDTIYLTGLSMSQDTTIITIHDLTAPDSTAYYTVVVETKVSSYTAISPLPQVVNFGLPMAIEDVKGNDANGVALKSGQLATILGVVTVANEFGGPSFIQDNTGGIAVFGSALSANVVVGDEVLVSGKVEPFNGLMELVSPILHSVVSSGNTLTPLDLTCSDIKNDGAGGVENYEGLLVRINGVVARTSGGQPLANWTVSGSGTNYKLYDGNDTVDIRVDNGVDFANTPAPQSAFDLIAVVSQFKSTLPFIGGYQLQPRSSQDILSEGPLFATSPVESNLTSSSFQINWTTLNQGSSRLKYGTTTAYELGILEPDNTLRTSHELQVTGLSAATIYHVQAFSVAGDDTSFAGDLVVSTASPAGSSGEINVYFNKTVNTTVSSGEIAFAEQDFISLIISRINNAQRSIDACLYSLSANNQGDLIAAALVSAKNRGVKVRVICEYDNSTGESFTTLANNGIPLITDRYDAVWNGQGLMHNKFFVFDGRGGAPESVWVWTGSWNPTNQGTVSDRQNVIEVQDVALAGAYTAEFNEMWGSSTDTPNAGLSRFGARKTDNVPHLFNVNGVPMNVSFSPSDQTTSRIRTTLAKAQNSISAALLTFTRKDLADTIINKKNAGRKARILMSNNTDTGNQFSYLQSSGVEVRLAGGSGLLHHKYALVDAESGSEKYTITGSHNWSNSAENSNDENILIVQDNRVTNLYLQEFAARYYEAGGTDSFVVTASNPSYAAAPSALDFDSVVVGQSSPDSFVVSNGGTGSLTMSSVTSTSPRFTVTPTSTSVPASGSKTFTVTFSPTSLGTVTGFIVITHNAGGSPDSIALTGVGSPVPDMASYSASPLSIAFDTVVVGESASDSFMVTNSGTLNLEISGLSSTSGLYSIVPSTATIAPSDTQTFTVTFTPTANGSTTAHAILTHNASGSPDSISLSGVGKVVIEPVSVGLTLSEGWNMISVPASLSSMAKDAIFPTSISDAYFYLGSYARHEVLKPGTGYWLKFPADTAVTLTGNPVESDTIDLSEGWNMVGSISYPVASSDVMTIPPSILASQFYAYDGRYIPSDTVMPALGYWIKSSSDGELILTRASGSRSSSNAVRSVSIPEGLHRIIIADAAGHAQTLSFGRLKENDVLNLEQFELPPAPPAGVFDVRFRSQRLLEAYSSEGPDRKREFDIDVASASFPLTITLDLSGEIQQKVSIAGAAGMITLTDGSQLTLQASAGNSLRLILDADREIPSSFGLRQNFPNPFNPRTTIMLDLAAPSVVSLTVHNLLGQHVRTLVDGKLLIAGSHDMEFDANDLPSGLYVYRVVARPIAAEGGGSPVAFVASKKMMITK